MVVIKSIDPISAGKVIGILYAIFGFLYGILFSLISVAVVGLLNNLPNIPTSTGGVVMPTAAIPGGVGSFFGLFGLFAVIIFPIIFGILGFIIGALGAFLYNVATSKIGGIEMELSDKAAK
ncbi:MAG: DUF3566 domain-containing protein [Candidatus Micrarchaeota archaeon]|nr:DUF3566 domain-containing protein [Candidatus Micrarchaeota archaeon]